MPIPAILLFIKAPRVGAVKTRLVPLLTPEDAAAVAACLAIDTVAAAATCLPENGAIVIAYAPAEAEVAMRSVLGHQAACVRFLAQRGGDLGERLANAVTDAAATGLGPFVLLGADCPLLPGDAVRTSFGCLLSDRADVVLGPAEDGGYYLLGLRAAVPGLLDGIAWSTDTVFAQTQANAERLGLRPVTDLPRCYDIDTPADLLRLRDALASDPRPAPTTARWLRDHPLPLTPSAPGAGERP